MVAPVAEVAEAPYRLCVWWSLLGMSKMDLVPIPNRYPIYRTGYLFGTDSVPTFDIFDTSTVPVWYRFLPSNRYRTGTEPYLTEYIRYRYPLLRIFGTGTFGSGTGSVPVGTELIPSRCS
ncbi:hypothetical protein Hanom_Chr11g00975341 [Helianthus anomalus]